MTYMKETLAMMIGILKELRNPWSAVAVLARGVWVDFREVRDVRRTERLNVSDFMQVIKTN